MGGLFVFALVAGYIWVATKLFKHAAKRWTKAIIVIAAFLIPMADAIYGRIKLKQMCEAEGGMHIYRVVEGVEGFDNSVMTPHEEWIKKYGYYFVEGEEVGGKRSRISLQPDGKIRREVGIAPIAKYVYEVKKGDVRDTFIRIESRVRARDSGDVLSRDVQISYAGGWLERLVSGVYATRGNAGRCGPDILMPELVTKTLKPTK
ncbi:hypothetical protein [Azonexus sp. IMCC34839]|uniref:hypothetical protein n=1 Tax=Azonexus sp. IMCC34839 TaxID=3133695 RepID=UPI003999DA91